MLNEVLKEMAKEGEKLKTFNVHVPANVYDGKYYDYRTLPIHVIASSEKEASEVINKNKEEVLKKADTRRVRVGSTTRRYVAMPVAKNVFFKKDGETYYTRESPMSGKAMALNMAGQWVDVNTFDDEARKKYPATAATIKESAHDKEAIDNATILFKVFHSVYLKLEDAQDAIDKPSIRERMKQAGFANELAMLMKELQRIHSDMDDFMPGLEMMMHGDKP